MKFKIPILDLMLLPKTVFHLKVYVTVRVRLVPRNPFKPSSKIFLLTIPRWYFFVDHLCFLCLAFVMLSRLCIAALWSPAGKGLFSWLFFVMFNCVFVTFPGAILGPVWFFALSLSLSLSLSL